MDRKTEKVDSIYDYVGLGYAGMWASKWLLSSVFIKRNVLADAIDNASFRMSSGNGNSKWTYWDVIKKNIEICPRFIVGLSAIFVLYIFLKMYRKGVVIQRVKGNMVFLMIAIMPFIWYLLLKNHSYIHAFFAHRELSVAYLATLFYLESMVSDTSQLLKKNELTESE